MKLGIFMLVIGLLVGGCGAALWQYGQELAITVWGIPWESRSYEAGIEAKALGLGLTVFGGGLAIGGIVRMIVKR